MTVRRACKLRLRSRPCYSSVAVDAPHWGTWIPVVRPGRCGRRCSRSSASARARNCTGWPTAATRAGSARHSPCRSSGCWLTAWPAGNDPRSTVTLALGLAQVGLHVELGWFCPKAMPGMMPGYPSGSDHGTLAMVLAHVSPFSSRAGGSGAARRASSTSVARSPYSSLRRRPSPWPAGLRACRTAAAALAPESTSPHGRRRRPRGPRAEPPRAPRPADSFLIETNRRFPPVNVM